MVLDWGVRPTPGGLLALPLALVVFFTASSPMTASAVWVATSLELPSFPPLTNLSRRQRWQRFANYRIGTGVLIYLTSGALYLTTQAAEFRPAEAYNLNNKLKVFTLSARAAFAEETMFRLFAILFLVSVGMRFHGWRPRFGFESGNWGAPGVSVRPPKRMVLIAFIFSSLIFGMAHSNNPIGGFMFGLLLGAAFLRGGWESAATAHFFGNYLLFTGIYL